LIQNNQAFLHTFLQKKKGKYSSGNDNNWDKLADDVNKYSAMSGDADIYLDIAPVTTTTTTTIHDLIILQGPC